MLLLIVIFLLFGTDGHYSSEEKYPPKVTPKKTSISGLQQAEVRSDPPGKRTGLDKKQQKGMIRS